MQLPSWKSELPAMLKRALCLLDGEGRKFEEERMTFEELVDYLPRRTSRAKADQQADWEIPRDRHSMQSS